MIFVGIPADSKIIGPHPFQAVGEKYIRAVLDGAGAQPVLIPSMHRGLDLDELLFKYGVRINPDLVQDLQCDVLPQTVGMVGDKPQIELLQWPYFPLLYPTADHPIVKNIMRFYDENDTFITFPIFASLKFIYGFNIRYKKWVMYKT